MSDQNLPPITAEEQIESARETIHRLEEQLRRTPKTRPFERAVLRYNIGLAYSESPWGQRDANLGRAAAALRDAVRLFNPERRPLEHARAQNALGAVLRELRELAEAAEAFRVAAELVPPEVNPGEHGAAMNNLGLVLTDQGSFDDAIEAFEAALSAFVGDDFLRQRIAALHNLGQALAAGEEPARVEQALRRYEEALDVADPQEHPYQWGLLHHSSGVTYISLSKPELAVDSLRRALRVFTRQRFPFQHALTKNNLGLAYSQIGGTSPLRRALVVFEDALRLFDIRMHREQWEQTYRNLELVEKALEDAGEPGTRAVHFARLAAEEQGDALVTLLRDRLSEFTLLPDPRRIEALAELDHAILSLGDDEARKVSGTWLAVLMELPHEQFVAGLKGRMLVHQSLDGDARERAAAILDHAIQHELLAPQRIRVRDTLYQLGYERPQQ